METARHCSEKCLANSGGPFFYIDGGALGGQGGRRLSPCSSHRHALLPYYRRSISGPKMYVFITALSQNHPTSPAT